MLWAGLGWLWWRRFGVELRPDALMVYGFRRQAIPWSAIDRVERSTSFGSTYLKVHVDGRRRRLRAPQHTPFLSPDDEFEAKAAVVLRTWEARRGHHWLVSA